MTSRTAGKSCAIRRLVRTVERPRKRKRDKLIAAVRAIRSENATVHSAVTMLLVR
jgi:hypothetical protein